MSWWNKDNCAYAYHSRRLRVETPSYPVVLLAREGQLRVQRRRALPLPLQQRLQAVHLAPQRPDVGLQGGTPRLPMGDRRFAIPQRHLLPLGEHARLAVARLEIRLGGQERRHLSLRIRPLGGDRAVLCDFTLQGGLLLLTLLQLRSLGLGLRGRLAQHALELLHPFPRLFGPEALFPGLLLKGRGLCL